MVHTMVHTMQFNKTATLQKAKEFAFEQTADLALYLQNPQDNPLTHNVFSQHSFSQSDPIIYENHGHLLIVVDEETVALIQPNWVAFLAKLPKVSFLMLSQTDQPLLRQIPYLQSFDHYYSHTVNPVQGYLGQFTMIGAHDKSFDMVLDLTEQGIILSPIPMPGYYSLEKQPQTIISWLAQAPELIGTFEKPQYIQWQEQACAHSACGMTGCTRCLTNCPAGALSSQPVTKGGAPNEHKIVVDVKLCQGVGSCALACPTDALQYQYPHNDYYEHYVAQLLKYYYQQHGTQAIILFYKRSEQAQMQEWLLQLPPYLLPIPLEDLAILGLSSWLNAFVHGAYRVLLLIDEPMQSCVFSLLTSQIQLLQSLLQTVDVYFDKSHDMVRFVNKATALTLFNEYLPVPFGIKLHKWREQSVDVPDGLNKKRAKLTQLLAYIRLNVAQVMPLESPLITQLDKGDSPPFGQVICDTNACTLCMGCVQICPTKSLSALDGETARLLFTEQDCIQCGLCVRGCPEQALQLAPRYLWDQSLRTTAVVLSEQKVARCLVCDKAFAPENLIKMMVKKLKDHAQFQGDAAKRLLMCDDCRVRDQYELFAQEPEKQLKL